MRPIRRAVRVTRGAERELEGWAVAGILACLLVVALAVTLAVFLIPAMVGLIVWLTGLASGGERGLRLKRRGGHIAWWPWRQLSKAIYGR
jgi:hypothetical protein